MKVIAVRMLGSKSILQHATVATAVLENSYQSWFWQRRVWQLFSNTFITMGNPLVPCLVGNYPAGDSLKGKARLKTNNVKQFNSAKSEIN